MKRWKISDVRAVVEKFEDDVKVFSFAGSLYRKSFEGVPKNDGFPYVAGTYDTVAHGTLERFVPGAQTVAENGNVYVRVAEELSWGNEYVEGRYVAVYARQDVIDDVVRALNDVGFYFEMPAFVVEGSTVDIYYAANPPYTVLLQAGTLNGYIRDNLSDDGYLFARIENGQITSNWKGDVTA
ncbi:hypothetical protein C0966_00860 [Bacillus methanolicus]|uniref:hypothetical protein n=1 Tax=Bacillus methanolicus TaxID=1471 RepID=UPI0023808BA6|nr:hypothetical protein [Bacillus methanolicus]MDE3837957.1 hypothetical protein [Bacillus methanolicus]